MKSRVFFIFYFTYGNNCFNAIIITVNKQILTTDDVAS